MTVTDRPPVETEVQPSRTRPSPPQIVSGVVLLMIGLLWLLERTGTIDISVTAVLAMATLVIGVSLMLLARRGSHVGLMVMGTIIGLVALLTAVAPFEGFQGGIGDRLVEISFVEEIRPDYNLAMGKLTIDLTETSNLGPSTSLRASVGMGELIVLVPEGTAIRVEGNVAIGELAVLDRSWDGVGVNETFETPGFGQSMERLTLKLQAFIGRVEVRSE